MTNDAGRFEELAAENDRLRRELAHLRAVEEQFRTFFDKAPIGKCMTAPDGRLLRVNPAFGAMLGYSPEEMQRVSFTEITHPDDVAESVECIRRLLAGERDAYDMEKRYIAKDGRLVWTHVTTRLQRDDNGAPLHFLTHIENITDRKAAERRAAAEELKVRTFVDNTADLVTVVDAQGHFIYVNNAARTILGRSLEELVGASAFDFVHPDDRAATQEAFGKWCAGGVTSASWENRQVSATGEARHLAWTVMPRYVGGQLESVWSVARDITERKRAEYAMTRLNESLIRSNKELEQFAYVASHDLQEPLRMVASYTQLLAQRYEGKLDDKADKYIAYAVDGAKRMQELINDLLAFSRVGTQAKEPQSTDCNELVAEVLKGLGKAVEESGAEVVVGELPTVLADRSQLGQVFQNLIGNAIKFRGEAPPRVEVTAIRSDRSWEFTVADNGIGIDESFHERIFVIFQRLHQRDRYPGSGIGLAIVKKIVERHGGLLRVESASGQGARFTFTLPAHGATPRTFP